MVYRYSWIAGVVGLWFAFTQLNGLLRSTSEGVPWQFVVIAAAVLGIIVTWAGLTYHLPGWVVVLLNGVALLISVVRVSSPETTRFLLPSRETFGLLEAQLDQAMDVIRSGIEPVIPLTGIVIVVMVVFWVAGIVLAWGLVRGHPYVALIPPLVLTLQFSTMNRGPSPLLEITLFVALVAATVLAIATDERAQTVGRMAPRGAWPSSHTRPPATSVGLLGVTVVAALLAVQTFQSLAPPDGWLDWRDERGLGSGYFGSVSYNPFISIRQSLVSQSDTPVFIAEIEGDLPADEVYFQFVTMDTYTGGQFFAADTPLRTLEEFPYEDERAAFDGPTAEVVATIQIERLRQEWLPSTYSVTAVAAEERLLRDLRIRTDDSSVVFPGGLTFEDMRYRITAAVPQPDLAVLATTDEGELSPAFQFAEDSAVIDGIDRSLIPTPTAAATVRDLPPDADRYLQLPEDESARIGEIAALARRQTANLTSDFEKALALESWFHSTEFRYRLLDESEVGHGASDVAAWLIDSDSPFHHEGYCENFATAMAVMARTLEIPSRVVLGFTPGRPFDDDSNRVVVLDRNAHAWVELWMPTQGWLRFDPTPRTQRDTPQTFEIANDELGFAITDYLDVPDPEILFDGDNPIGGQLGDLLDDFDRGDIPTDNFADPGSGGGFTLPGWITTVLFWLIAGAVVLGGIPALKWWQRRRRMARLRTGDITAAWQDIISRLDDLGEPVPATETPRTIADAIDPAMRPLATVYGRAIYGPEGSITDDHVAAATRSHEDTTMRLRTRYSTARRTVAWFRVRSILPRGLRRRRR